MVHKVSHLKCHCVVVFYLFRSQTHYAISFFLFMMIICFSFYSNQNFIIILIVNLFTYLFVNLFICTFTYFVFLFYTSFVKFQK